MHPSRLVLMGTGPFAVPSFEALRAAGHVIALVVTKPQSPVKSRKGPPSNPVRQWAEGWGLPIFDPQTINEEAAISEVAAKQPHLLVVCDYGHILKPAALATAQLGGINLHGSLLPKFRGAAPVQWALLSGELISGVSVIHMTPRLDGGPVLVTRQTAIEANETAGQLEERLAQLGIDATLEAIGKLADWDGNSVLGQLQDAAKVTKAPRLSKADGEIDWSRTAEQLDWHIRGMQPWPGAFTHLELGNGKPAMRLVIRGFELTETPSDDRISGEIVLGDGFQVATADRLVRIKRLQPAGKKEMTGGDFLRGHQPPAGTRLH
ncbi:MAG: methionyl-tRNA formyltransferase [Planctomycetota bacterium]|nr:methionyl-tRNA formyltransferase [Planctomycetota bacterium]